MKNVTASMAFLLDHARTRGESMASIPTDKLAELVKHLSLLDSLVITAETFVECAPANPTGSVWTEDEAEGLGFLRNVVKAVAS